MDDRERVIEGLRKAAEELARYAPMKVNGRCQMYFDEAIYLLKEQEAVKPIVEQYALPLTLTSVRFIKKYYCGICKEEITGNNVYCHKCGRKVKWDD